MATKCRIHRISRRALARYCTETVAIANRLILMLEVDEALAEPRFPPDFLLVFRVIDRSGASIELKGDKR